MTTKAGTVITTNSECVAHGAEEDRLSVAALEIDQAREGAD
jgi:hypothetical protein